MKNHQHEISINIERYKKRSNGSKKKVLTQFNQNKQFCMHCNLMR